MAVSIGRIAASVRKIFSDNLQRTSTGIGKASDGSIWTTIKSSFNISNGTATAAGSASDYPIAIQDMPYENANILVKSPSNGAGASFWVTDSGNWWAVATEQTTTSCNCSNYSYCTASGCTGYGCSSYGCTSSYCTSYYCYNYGCTGYGCTNYGSLGQTCAMYAGSYCIYYTTSYGCTGYGCTASGCTGSACGGYACNGYGCTGYGCSSYGCTSYATGTTCETCYPRSIRVLQSVASAISTIYSYGISAAASALRVKTRGTSIEITAYSDTNATSQIDSPVTYDATGATKTKKHGLIVSPATYGQGTTVGEITISQN